MKTLHALQQDKAEEESGFFYVLFEDGRSVQCCLHEPNAILIGDTGFDEGLCKECNEWALEEYGKEHTLDFLLTIARKNGVDLLI